MSEWKNHKFKELFDIPLRNGLTKPSKVRGSGIRMVNMKEIFGYDVITDDTPMELVPVTEKEQVSLLEYDDLLFARQSLVESGAGKIAIFKGQENTVFESHLIRCRINPSKSFPQFIYYLFNSPLGKGTVSAIVTQTAAAGIKGSDLQELEFKIPPLPEQKAIAAVLSSLDDKIDLLHRQNKTLEAMAETLFRQWFIEEAEEGWQEGVFGDYVSNVKEPLKVGHSLTGRKYVPIDEIPMRRLGLSSSKPLSEAKSSLIAFQENDILFGAMRPYFHRVNFSHFLGVTRTTTLVLRPKFEHYLAFALFFLNQDSSVKYADSHSTGSTMPYVSWNNSLELLPLNKPEESVLKAFHENVKPMLLKITHNVEQVRFLENYRDTILPKLMSGEVRVSLE